MGGSFRKKRVISEALESIAHIPDKVARETFVQHLNSLTKMGDRALHEELGKILKEVKEQKARARRRQQRQAQREVRLRSKDDQQARDHHTQAFEAQMEDASDHKPMPPKDRPGYEKELIRLMLLYDRDMIDYIGSNCSEVQFEDDDLRAFYTDIIERYKDEEEVSVDYYASRDHPYPELVGEIVLQEHEVSERHHEKVGVQYKKDKNPYMTAKGALKASRMHHLDRLQDKLQKRYANATGEDRKTIMKNMKEVGRQRSMLQKSSLNELFPDPNSDAAKKVMNNKFEYKMKGEE